LPGILLRINGVNKNSIYRHILFSLLVVFLVTGASACGRQSYPTPVFMQAPDAITLSKLLDDYEADPDRADRVHTGQTYFFAGIVVEDILSDYTDHYAFEMGEQMYLESKHVKFLPSYVYDLDPIGPGYVVDVVGTVAGWVNDTFYVSSCTFNVIKGGNLPAASEY